MMWERMFPRSPYLGTLSLLMLAAVMVAESTDTPLATLSTPLETLDSPSATVKVNFSAHEYHVNESDREAIVMVAIETDNSVNLTIMSMELVSSTAPAKASSDFALVPYQLSLSSGERLELELGFPVYQDGLAEPCQEAFAVKVMSLDPKAAIFGVTCVTVVVHDDDDPILTFAKDIFYVEEEMGEFQLPLQIQNVENVEVELVVTYTPNDDSQENPFPEGAVSAVLSPYQPALVALPIRDNRVHDGPRAGWLTVEYRAVRTCLQRPPLEASVRVAVVEQDVLEFTFENRSYSVAESDGTVTIAIVRNGQSAVPVDVAVTAVSDTATRDEDFLFPPPDYRIHFLPNESRKSFEIAVLNDKIQEPTETFELHLSSIIYDEEDSSSISQNGTWNIPRVPLSFKELVSIDDVAIVTIEDDENSTIEFAQASYQATVSTGTENITVLRSGDSVVTATVKVTAEYEGAEGFPDQVQFIKIRSKETNVHVFVGADGIYNPSAKWKIRMEILDPVSGFALGARSTTEMNILESDTLLVTFTRSSFYVRESRRMAFLHVKWLGRTAVPLQLLVEPFQLGSSTQHPATAGEDFSLRPVQFSIFPTRRPGMMGSVPVFVLDDRVYERPESFGVRLRSRSAGAGGAAVRIQPLATTTVIIVDDESVVLGFNETTLVAEESRGSVNICVKAVGMRDVPLHILLTTPPSPQTTAIGGIDYEDLYRSLTLPPSHTSPSSTTCTAIHIYQDPLSEADKTFIVELEPMDPLPRVTTSARQVTVVLVDRDQTTAPSQQYTCLLSADAVTPFFLPRRNASVAPPPSYPTQGTQCEHVLFRGVTSSSPSSSPGVRVEVLVDLNPGEPFGFEALTVKVNQSRLAVNSRGQVEDLSALGSPVETTTEGTLYREDIFVANRSDGFGFHFRSFGLKVETVHDDDRSEDDTHLRIELDDSSTLVASGNGLCGNVSGDLVSPDGVVSEAGDVDSIESWRVLRRALPGRSVCRRTISVTGDPVLSVPLSGVDMSLCFELRGRPNTVFNLISDECLSVNALFGGTPGFTFMQEVAILAEDQAGACHRIVVTHDNGCRVTVDGEEEEDDFESGGVTVRREGSAVTVVAPNCHRYGTVMMVKCTRIGKRNLDILELHVLQGGSLTPTAHGILGQFWNVPVEVTQYEVEDRNRDNAYQISVPYPGAETRHFVGKWVAWNWEGEETDAGCLYAGNSQGGASAEFEDFNDSVIMGTYRDYAVPSLFASDYSFSQLESRTCKDRSA